jgi:hypothetical protein
MPPTNIPDLTARQLHAVLAVAEYNGFIAAAAFLKTSQPALSRTIKRVEDIVGVRPFDRSMNDRQSTSISRKHHSENLAGRGLLGGPTKRMGEGLRSRPLTQPCQLELLRRPLPQGERAQA